MNLRHAAFLSLADAALIATHPDAEVRHAAINPAAWPALLTVQLARREAEALGVAHPTVEPVALTPLELHRRRATLRQWARHRAARRSLPRAWRTLADLTARPLEQWIERLGLDVIAAAARGASRPRVESWLTRLGPTHAPRVLRRLADGRGAVQVDAQTMASLKSLVQSAFDRDADASSTAVVCTLGVAGLASLFATLDDAQRGALEACCQSSLIDLLRPPDAPDVNGSLRAFTTQWLDGRVRAMRRAPAAPERTGGEHER